MTTSLSTTKVIGAVTTEWSDRVYELAEAMRGNENEVDMPIEHHLHAGMYSRTLFQPAGILCAAARIIVPTQLIVQGKCRIYAEGNAIDVEGHQVLEGEAGRQVIVYTYEDTWVSVCFGTSATTVDEAEREMVGDDFRLLSNHREK